MTNEKELATTQTTTPTDVATRGGQREGIDMHQGDILPAFINIVQGTSEHGTPGMFRRADTGEEYTELKVVPIRIQKNRDDGQVVLRAVLGIQRSLDFLFEKASLGSEAPIVNVE